MALRKKKKGSQPETVAVSQTGKNNHPFYLVGSYFPSAAAEASLYKSLREAVPIIDAAIYKLIRLLGKFSVSTGNKRIDKELSIFLDNVSVGGT